MHALKANEEFHGKKFEYVAMIQPTSPMRTPDDLKIGYKTILNGKHDAVWSVSLADKKYHPLLSYLE